MSPDPSLDAHTVTRIAEAIETVVELRLNRARALRWYIDDDDVAAIARREAQEVATDALSEIAEQIRDLTA